MLSPVNSAGYVLSSNSPPSVYPPPNAVTCASKKSFVYGSFWLLLVNAIIEPSSLKSSSVGVFSNNSEVCLFPCLFLITIVGENSCVLL